jgi:hypothetical protein
VCATLWGSINLHLHSHVLFFEGVCVDRSDKGLTPRFVKVEPPSDADITTVVEKISHRVIRTLRQLGYLEADLDTAVATGYDPLGDDEPELARTMAASVQQRIAFGERAGQKVRRIGSGFGYEGERPALTGTRCASVHGFSLHANVSVPAHRRDQLARLIRSTARGAVSLERLEADGPRASNSPHWNCWRSWRRWCRCRGCTWYATAAVWRRTVSYAASFPRRRASKAWKRRRPAAPRRAGAGRDCSSERVFAFDMERCPACGRGTLRIIAAITHAAVIRKILCPLTLAAEPSPIAPARACQATFAWTSPSPDSASSHVPWERGMAGVRPLSVTLAACGEHERVRDVSWSTRRGFWVRRGGF